MAREENDLPLLPGVGTQKGHDLDAAREIEEGRDLVEDHKVRGLCKRSRDHHALALAVAEVAEEAAQVLGAEHEFRIGVANEGRIGVTLRNSPAITPAPVPGPQHRSARPRLGEGFQSVDLLRDHLDESVGLRLFPGQQTHQEDPCDAAHMVRLGIDEGRHDRNAERLDTLHMLGVREVGHARDQHVGRAATSASSVGGMCQP